MLSISIFLSLLIFANFISVSYSVGPLVCIGGGLEDDNEEIYNKIITLAGGKNKARIGLVTAGITSENYVASAIGYIQPFIHFGALEVTLINVAVQKPGNENNPDVVKIVSGMTGFYFGGGDQDQLKSVLSPNNNPSPVLEMIRKLWVNGSVLAGSSAGCDIMQGIPMITGGENYESLVYGDTPGGESHLSYNPKGGFGFFNLGLIDTHVGWRGRIGRTVALMNATQRNIAFGMDQNTAILVEFLYWTSTPSQIAKMTVIGEEGVSVVRTAGTGFHRVGFMLNITNVTISYFTKGDSFIYNGMTGLLTSTITHWKTPMAGRETHQYPSRISHDIWSSFGSYDNPREFIKIAQDLHDCSKVSFTEGYANKTSPVTMRVRIDKGKGFKGYLAENNKTYISILGMRIDIVAR